MQGDGNAVIGSVWETDERSRAFLPGEAADLGTVHIVKGEDGARVDVGPYS